MLDTVSQAQTAKWVCASLIAIFGFATAYFERLEKQLTKRDSELAARRQQEAAEEARKREEASSRLLKEIAHKQSAQPPEPKPRFKERITAVSISMGGMRSTTTLNKEGDSPIIVPVGTEPPNPIKATYWNGELFVDATICIGPGQPVVKLRDNEIIDKPPTWDKNFNNSALEIVDDRGVPVFQLIYTSANSASLKGAFMTGGSILLFDDFGMRAGDSDPTTPLIISPNTQGGAVFTNRDGVSLHQAYRLTPLFKYPSWKFFGVLAQ